jgi:hypothetical protein
LPLPPLDERRSSLSQHLKSWRLHIVKDFDRGCEKLVVESASRGLKMLNLSSAHYSERRKLHGEQSVATFRLRIPCSTSQLLLLPTSKLPLTLTPAKPSVFATIVGSEGQHKQASQARTGFQGYLPPRLSSFPFRLDLRQTPEDNTRCCLHFRDFPKLL